MAKEIDDGSLFISLPFLISESEMQMRDADEPAPAMIEAIGLGMVAGLISGAALGTLVVVLLASSSEMVFIVFVHAMFAMMIMGGWLAPALLQPGEAYTQSQNGADCREQTD